MSRKTAVFFFLLVFCSLRFSVQAFQFKPIAVDFSPEGKNSTRSFLVNNDGNQSIAIQVSMTTREIDIDGVESREEAAEDFIVYPSQMILLPGEAQTVRVSWAGPPDIKKEYAYRIIGEQLPIDMREESHLETPQGEFNISMRYIGSVYVAPEGAKPDLTIDSAEIIKNEEGKDVLEVIFYNKGTAHSMLRDIVLEIFSKKGREAISAFSSNEVPDFNRANILAGAKRRILIDWSKNLSKGEVEVILK